MTFLWYVNVALCCICLTNVLAYQFFCCCVTGHSLAWSSCGKWTFSPIASVWLNCQHIISFPILFDWTSSCTTLLWYVNVVSCCNYLISFFVAYQFFLLFCDCLLPCTIFLYVNVAFCCSCLTSVPRSISFLPFFLCVTGHCFARFFLWYVDVLSCSICLIKIRSIPLSFLLSLCVMWTALCTSK